MAEKNIIPSTDKTAMDNLYRSEVTRLTAKAKTAGEVDTKEDGPIPADAQAFKDHKELISVLEDVMSEDKREGWSPNDEILD